MGECQALVGARAPGADSRGFVRILKPGGCLEGKAMIVCMSRRICVDLKRRSWIYARSGTVTTTRPGASGER